MFFRMRGWPVKGEEKVADDKVNENTSTKEKKPMPDGQPPLESSSNKQDTPTASSASGEEPPGTTVVKKKKAPQ